MHAAAYTSGQLRIRTYSMKIDATLDTRNTLLLFLRDADRGPNQRVWDLGAGGSHGVSQLNEFI